MSEEKPQQRTEPVKAFAISETFREKLVDYLGGCPYKEVHSMIFVLRNLPEVKIVKGQEDGKEQ